MKQFETCKQKYKKKFYCN